MSDSEIDSANSDELSFVPYSDKSESYSNSEKSGSDGESFVTTPDALLSSQASTQIKKTKSFTQTNSHAQIDWNHIDFSAQSSLIDNNVLVSGGGKRPRGHPSKKIAGTQQSLSSQANRTLHDESDSNSDDGMLKMYLLFRFC